MRHVVSGILIGGSLVIMGIVLGQSGLLSFGLPGFLDPTRSEAAVLQSDEAEITAVEPISLDCRARVHARVPVEGVREHEMFGQVYRTDRVTLDAVGDVDTCVDGGSTEIVTRPDGTTEVIVDASAITFQRPRVDMVATADTLTVEEGLVGKVTDVFPWVDDNLGLTPLAYAYAQTVIGSSACMETAYDTTREVLTEAYRQQLVDQGIDPDTVTVTVEGEPTFTEPEQPDMGGIEMSVGGRDEIVCTADNALVGVAAAAR
ncbi:MAG: hypothetical protein ACK5PP_06130 [Acidimicrobiales bacterium]